MNTPNIDLTTLAIKSNGSSIPDEFQVNSVIVEKELNRISKAEITLLDGSAETEQFPASDSSTFVPGTEIIIEAGYNDSNKSIFEGIVIGQRLQIDEEQGPLLIVECCDKAIKMTIGLNSRSFVNQTDSDILTTLINNNGLTASVSSTEVKWQQQVQYNATDWDYLLSRAAANSLLVSNSNGMVTAQKPDKNTNSVITATYGESIFEIDINLNASDQLSSVKASSWDYKDQTQLSSTTKNTYSGPGNLSSTQLSDVIGLEEYNLQTTAVLDQKELTNWTQAQLLKSNYSKIQGEVKIQGTSSIEPLNYITLNGIGDRFSGDHLVSNVTHYIESGVWITKVSIGLLEKYLYKTIINDTDASGLIPAMKGLFNGIVKQIDGDPNHQYRILVDVPFMDNTGNGLWARYSNFYASNNAGALFLPEIGDEVVLGCLNEDPRSIVILGSLYSNPKNSPNKNLTLDNDNTVKALVTKSGLRLEFHETDNEILITTPNENSIVLSDKEKNISIKDQNDNKFTLSDKGISMISLNNNKLTLSDKGISMTSPKDISIEANGKLSLKGDQGVEMMANGGDVKTSGININQRAEMSYTANATQASIEGDAELTLKGAMVMIN